MFRILDFSVIYVKRHKARVAGVMLWIILASLTILTWFSSLEFNQEGIRILFIFITTSGLPIALFLTTKDDLKKRTTLVFLFVLIILTTVILRMLSLLTFGSGYVTQELIYVSKNDSKRRIEFQMEDLGALGYNRRTVKIEPFFLFFSWINEVQEDEIDNSKWKYVGEYKNELGLKGY